MCFDVARHNSLPVTWVTRCLQGDLGGCFQWSLLCVGGTCFFFFREFTFESWTRHNLRLVRCGVLFTLVYLQTGGCGAPVFQKFSICSLPCVDIALCVCVAPTQCWCVVSAFFLLNVVSYSVRNVRKLNKSCAGGCLCDFGICVCCLFMILFVLSVPVVS